MAQTKMKVKTDRFSTEKIATEQQKQKQRITATGIYNEQHSSSSQSNITHISAKNLHSGIAQQVILIFNRLNLQFY